MASILKLYGLQTSYANLLQDYPFKGQEAQLKALEEHDMIVVSYIDGKPESP